MVENYLYFTELAGMPVLDLKHRRIGRVRDAAIVPVVDSSRIDRVLVGGGDSWLTIRYDQIQSIALGKGIALSDEQLTPYHEDEFMLRIGRDLLDQQIIDVTGRKVVRVNDLTFEIRNDGERDTLVVPSWREMVLEAETDLVLFGYSDRTAQEKLGLFRERRG